MFSLLLWYIIELTLVVQKIENPILLLTSTSLVAGEISDLLLDWSRDFIKFQSNLIEQEKHQVRGKSTTYNFFRLQILPEPTQQCSLLPTTNTVTMKKNTSSAAVEDRLLFLFRHSFLLHQPHSLTMSSSEIWSWKWLISNVKSFHLLATSFVFLAQSVPVSNVFMKADS